MAGEWLTLGGITLLLVGSLAGLVLLLSNLQAVLLVWILAAILGRLSEALYPSPFRRGWLSATAIGLAGSLVGQLMLGHWGPRLAGFALIPCLLGALTVNVVLRVAVWRQRIRKLEEYQSRRGKDPLICSRLEQTRIIRLLGSGTFSRVYQAVPERSLRETESVAIKVFKPSAMEEPDFLPRLQREVAACQCLDHPNIVRLLRADQQNDIHYLVMEYVDGITLSQKLRSQTMTVAESVHLLIEICDALHYAHQKGVIHRDIKPDNIMIGVGGVKIMDFGLARVEGAETLTQAGSALGTPHYMSPEQVLGQKALDGRSDQYSLGCLAYEMLTGRQMFAGQPAATVVAKQLSETPRPPRELCPELPEALDSAIMKMLAKEPDARFPSLDCVAQALRQSVQATGRD